jgi:acetyl-CoA synthetase
VTPQASWTPSEEAIARANVTDFARERGFTSYAELWRWSVRERADFWEAVVDRLGIVFETPPAEVLDQSDGPQHASWLVGAELNIVESCFQQPDDQLAIVDRRGGALRRTTYGQLASLVDAASATFEPGERVAIAMPMTLEAVVAYLAVIRAGGVVVSIADSFSAEEIATRLRIGGAEVVVTQDVVRRDGKTLPMAEKIWAAGAERTVVVPAGEECAIALRPGDRLWSGLQATEPTRRGVVPAHIGSGDRYSNILFSSGTTADPKAIPWTHVTPIKAAMDGHFHQDIQHDDVVCWPTNLGWMMGPWLIYASLINGAAIALYDDAPTGPAFGNFVHDAGVTMLGVVPSLVARWRASGCMEGADWSGIRLFSSTGEAADASDMGYLADLAGGVPVMEYCGGTEIGGAYITSTVVDPVPHAAFSTPTLGIDIAILDEAGQHSSEGEVFLIPPSIGMSGELLNANHEAVYYDGLPRPGLRRHGDRMIQSPDGFYRALGRMDDAMNLGGIKVGSAEIERVLGEIPGISELAAVAVRPPEGGPERLVVFVVPEGGAAFDGGAVLDEMRSTLRDHMNPLFKLSEVVPLDELPRTASNKVMRRVLRERIA